MFHSNLVEKKRFLRISCECKIKNLAMWLTGMGDAAELLDSIVAVLLVGGQQAHGHLGVGADLVLQGAQVRLGVVVRQLAPTDGR